MIVNYQFWRSNQATALRSFVLWSADRCVTASASGNASRGARGWVEGSGSPGIWRAQKWGSRQLAIFVLFLINFIHFPRSQFFLRAIFVGEDVAWQIASPKIGCSSRGWWNSPGVARSTTLKSSTVTVKKFALEVPMVDHWRERVQLGWIFLSFKSKLVGGNWLPWIWHFPINIGFRLSSQLTNSYFSEGFKPPTSKSPDIYMSNSLWS